MLQTATLSPSSPLAATLVSLVHSAGEGRLRVHVRGLYRSEKFGAELERKLPRLPEVSEASVNLLTGNVLLRLAGGEKSRTRVFAELENMARRYVDAAAAPRAGAAEVRKPTRVLRRGALKLRADAARSGTRPNAPPPAEPAENWWTLDTRETIRRLETSRTGLSRDEARQRLEIYGPNRLEELKRRPPLRIFLEQLANPAMAMLGVSAVVAVATGGMVDAAVIVGAVLLNSFVGFVTESSSERTIADLGQMTPKRALAMRDGAPIDIPVEDIVVGDILLLTPGTYVAADARLLNSNFLTVDESALTGESLPVGKHWDFIGNRDTPLADRKNILHMGAVVTGGSGQAVTIATGRRTEIGTIQSLVGEVRPPDTLLQRQLDEMNARLSIGCGILCAGVFGLGLLRGYTWLRMLSTSISLAVAAIPEGLPAVATTTLAIGIRNMQREHVLIRHLPAVESLGSVQVICLDKTGTLTRNKMKATTLRTASHSASIADARFMAGGEPFAPMDANESRLLLRMVSLCSEVKLNGSSFGERLQGSSTESALVEAAMDAGEDVRALRAAFPLLKTAHRAEKRPYMTTVHADGDAEILYAVKGAPQDVLRLCDRRQRGDTAEPLDERARCHIVDENDRMAGEALRVLGVAYARAIRHDDIDPESTPPLIWLGLIGMEDALRPDMDRLIARFHEAGVRTVMITGDQSVTAYSVGKRLGLSMDGPLEIVDSTNLDKLDPGILKGVVKGTSIFARVSPAHKLKIVQALQETGHVTAMTGDGVNDGPALKAADIGVAMGEQGTDVARSVADVVLEDDNLQTMVVAIRQGRTIYNNIRKSLRFLLSTNLSEIELAVATLALGMGEALNPLQYLWINIVADVAPALALALEPPERDVLKQPPRDPAKPIVDGKDFRVLLRESLLIAACSAGVYGLSLRRHGSTLQANSNTFMAFTLAEILHGLACRSEETTVLDRDRPRNGYMTAAVAGTLALQAMTALVPSLRKLLRTSPLAPADLPLIFAGAAVPFAINESLKLAKKGQRPDGDAAL